MMDGRVKTLHPLIHGGILARRDIAGDLRPLARHGIGPSTWWSSTCTRSAKRPPTRAATFDELIENIDIGGPSMVRAAAKNFDDVVVVTCRPTTRACSRRSTAGGPSMAVRFDLAGTPSRTRPPTTRPLRTSSRRWPCTVPSACAAERDVLPSMLVVAAAKVRTLRYGENPHQPAAWYVPADAAAADLPAVLQGKELSFTNLLDVDAAARIASEFDEPAAVVIKHTNPCGVATGASLGDAYVRARDADPLSAFGGIVGCNRALDEATAKAIASTFIEAVIGPSIAGAALTVLAAKKNLRVVIAPRLFSTRAGRTAGIGRLDLRTALGGVLAQEQDRVVEAWEEWPRDGGPEVVTKRAPSAAEWKALRFAWRVCAHVKSNTVIFTADDRTLAVGAGQMSRVDAVNVARMKAESGTVPLAGSVAASDAFFPFRDGLDAVVAAGATAVIQPGGSVRDADVIAAADEHGIAMVFTRRRHFRH